MTELLRDSSVWGAVLTAGCFCLFFLLQKKVRKPWCNPLLFSSMTISVLLLTGGIPYAQYRDTSSVLSWLLLPATVSLAVPLYEQWKLLKQNWPAVFCGIFAGVVTSLACAVVLAKLFSLPADVAVSFLPKSVTTAIGADISEELGGIPALSIVLIILTGIAGNMMAPFLCRVFRLRHAVSRGIATGTCSHAIGTARAMEMGEAEGAMSGLAIAAAGIMTAVLVPLAARLLT